MKISVALCTYNGARYLEAQLRSIAEQDRLPDELVICDDRSTDATADILARLTASCPFEVRFEVNRENLGSSKNFARAVSLCTGEIIALSDQDDVWLPNKLERFESAFAKEPELGFVFSDAIRIDEQGCPLPDRLWQAIDFDEGLQRAFNAGKAFESLLRRNLVTGACMAFRSVYRDMLLPVAATWVHDGWFALLISAVAPCRAIGEPLSEYRQHPEQQIGARKDSLYRQYLRGKSQGRREFEEIADNYAAARRRLSEFRSRMHDEKLLRLLDEKVEHFRAKARMRDSKVVRLPLILKELFRFHYRRYSRGWKSLAQDMFL